jgi:hypothetical protein
MNDHRPTETPTCTCPDASPFHHTSCPIVQPVDQLEQMTKTLATLTAQLEEARRDSARLDWLEAQCVDIFVDESPIERRNGMSLRQAIDAALTERKEKV